MEGVDWSCRRGGHGWNWAATRNPTDVRGYLLCYTGRGSRASTSFTKKNGELCLFVSFQFPTPPLEALTYILLWLNPQHTHMWRVQLWKESGPIVKELLQLAERELDLLSRGLMTTSLNGLQSRLRALLRHFIANNKLPKPQFWILNLFPHYIWLVMAQFKFV